MGSNIIIQKQGFRSFGFVTVNSYFLNRLILFILYLELLDCHFWEKNRLNPLVLFFACLRKYFGE